MRAIMSRRLVLCRAVLVLVLLVGGLSAFAGVSNGFGGRAAAQGTPAGCTPQTLVSTNFNDGNEAGYVASYAGWTVHSPTAGYTYKYDFGLNQAYDNYLTRTVTWDGASTGNLTVAATNNTYTIIPISVTVGGVTTTGNNRDGVAAPVVAGQSSAQVTIGPLSDDQYNVRSIDVQIACTPPPVAHIALTFAFCAHYASRGATFSTFNRPACGLSSLRTGDPFRGGEVTLSSGHFLTADGADTGSATVTYDENTSGLDLYIAAGSPDILTATTIDGNRRTSDSVGLNPTAGQEIPLTFTYDYRVTNTSPSIRDLSDATTTAGTSVFDDFTAIDTEDSGNVTVTVTQPANGVVTLSGSFGNFRYTYRPNPGFGSAATATDSFTVTVTDKAPPADRLSRSQIVTVTVNPPPVAVDDTFVTAEDTPVTGNVLANDPSAFVSVSSGTMATAHGSVTLGSNGLFTYTPALNYNGTDTFSYIASRGDGSTSQATVTITVTAVNDAPVAIPDTYTATEDTVLDIGPAQGVLANDTDADGDRLSVNSYSDPAYGTLTIRQNGSFVYRPAANFSGTDSFTYVVDDGAARSGGATVTITVAAVNDAPVAASDSYQATEDTPLVVTAPGVLGNDSDVDRDALTAAVVTGPAHGTLVLNANGSFTYTPAANFNGPDSFTYRISDGISASTPVTVSISVTAVNDPPVIDDTTVPEDQTVEATSPAGATASFTPPTATDPDGAAPTVICDPASGSTFPVGTTTVTCTASDGAVSDTATFAVTVKDTTAPVVNEETVPGTGTPRILTVEATGPVTTVRWDPLTATDAVDGTITLACRIDADADPATLPTGDIIGASGTTFPIGDTLITCVGEDGSANTVTTSFTVRVVDTTAPVLTVPANRTVEATSSAGAVVTYTATASDLVDGSVIPVCTPASGSTFPIGTTTVSCTATDAAGNTSAAKIFTITVRDTTGPVITWVGGPQPGKTYTQATLPAEPTCTATDTSSPVVQCRVYGYSTAPGTHTLTARARDAEGNASVSTRTYTVTAGAPTATPRPATATPRPATATPRPATATATPRPATATPPPATATPVPAQPTAVSTRAPRPTATPVTPTVPTTAPTRAPRG